MDRRLLIIVSCSDEMCCLSVVPRLFNQFFPLSRSFPSFFLGLPGVRPGERVLIHQPKNLASSMIFNRSGAASGLTLTQWLLHGGRREVKKRPC